MLIKNICKNLKILKKIKTWSVGYTTSVRNWKRKLMSSQGVPLIYLVFQPIEVVSRYRDPQLQEAENYTEPIFLIKYL